MNFLGQEIQNYPVISSQVAGTARETTCDTASGEFTVMQKMLDNAKRIS